eukprot:gene5644-6513_t
MKRRAVRRVYVVVPLDFFNDEVFCFYQSQVTPAVKESKSTKELTEVIKAHSGKVTSKLTKKVDYLLVHSKDQKEKDIVAYNLIIEAAEKVGAKPVESSFITTCSTAKKIVDPAPFVVSQRKVPVVVAPPPPVVVAAPVVVVAATPVATKKPDASYFLAGIDSIVGEDVTGTNSWLTLGDAITKFKGTLKDGIFAFEEYELVQGNEDDIELPSSYTATILLDVMTGKVEDSTFKLTLTKSPPVAMLKQNSQYKGTVTQYDEFKLKVAKRSEDSITGTIVWPSHNSATAQFTGTILADGVSVTKYTEGKVLGPEISTPFKSDEVVTASTTSMLSQVMDIPRPLSVMMQPTLAGCETVHNNTEESSSSCSSDCDFDDGAEADYIKNRREKNKGDPFLEVPNVDEAEVDSQVCPQQAEQFKRRSVIMEAAPLKVNVSSAKLARPPSMMLPPPVQNSSDVVFTTASEPKVTFNLESDGTPARPSACVDPRVTVNEVAGNLRKTGGRIATWKNRFFRLTVASKTLSYYKSAHDINPLGVIPLVNVGVVVESSKFRFRLDLLSDEIKACKVNPDGTMSKSNHKAFTLQAPNQEACDIWMRELRKNIFNALTPLPILNTIPIVSSGQANNNNITITSSSNAASVPPLPTTPPPTIPLPTTPPPQPSTQ